MPVPTSTADYLVNTTGGAFTVQTEGGCILQNSSVTSGLSAVITKALSLKDGVALNAEVNTLPTLLTGDGVYNAQKALSGGTFAYSAEGEYVIAGQSTTLSGVSKTNLLFMGVGKLNMAINQFMHDFGAKTVTLMRRNRYSRTGYLLNGDTKVGKRSANLWLSATGHAHHTPATNTTTYMWDPINDEAAARTDSAANPTRAIPGELVMKADFVTLNPVLGAGDFFDYKAITGM